MHSLMLETEYNAACLFVVALMLFEQTGVS